MSDLDLYSVNWQDGMLVTQQHLKEQEQYFETLARWYALDVGDQYGLVRKSRSGAPALTLNLSLASNRLRVEVVRCQAVTPDGSVIEINDSTQTVVRGERDVSTPSVAVYLGVNAAARREFGDPDPGDDLPRIPYLAANYVLSLGEPPNLPEGRYLQIAQLSLEGRDVAPAVGYFPPCLSVYADEILTQKAHDYRNRLESLLALSSRAYVAITAGGALSGEKTDLQRAFKETIYQFAYHLSSTLDSFVVGHNAMHPLHMVVFFKRLFRSFTTLLNLQPGLKDFLNERFFVKELGSEVGRFVSSVEAFLMSEYDHTDLGKHVHAIDEILDQVRGIMRFLAQVKKEQLGDQAVATDTLTYRGQTLRLAEYSGSRLEQVGELAYLIIDTAEPQAINDCVILINKDLFSSAEWAGMQVRLGLNEARGLGETDPVDVDAVTFGNKVALHPQDMLTSPAVRQVTLIFRGAGDPQKLGGLGKMDLIVYVL